MTRQENDNKMTIEKICCGHQSYNLLVTKMWPLFLEAMKGYKWRPRANIGYHLIFTLKGDQGLGTYLTTF